MLTNSEIAAVLTTSRDEFARLFLQAQGGVQMEMRVEFEAIARGQPDDRSAFAAALTFAEGQGWLDLLSEEIVRSGLESGELAKAMMEEAARDNDAQLQAMVDEINGFDQPALVARGVADALRQTAKVMIDNKFMGTGCLIGPNLVLTAWHVVRKMFLPSKANGKTTWYPDADAAPRLRLVFDDFLALWRRDKALRPMTPIVVPAAQNWCVTFSCCHELELKNRLPSDCNDLQGFWDYVVLRVSKAPGLERGWIRIDSRALVPKAAEAIILFQNPAGQPTRSSRHEIAKPEDYGAREPLASTRFVHLANSVGGSSGGPCFDKTFSLFGFHQGVWDRRPSGNANIARVTNRGVPITNVDKHIKETLTQLPPPEPQEVPLWHLGAVDQYMPVLGREIFQSLVWRSAMTGAPKVVVISGQPGSGRTFLTRVLAHMLPDAQHFKIMLDSEIVAKGNALALARAIMTGAGAAISQLDNPDPVDSTNAVWRKDTLMLETTAALERVRGNRMLWIVFRNLNRVEIQGTDTRDFLQLLYEQVVAVEWLRIVLDGFQGDLPGVVRERSDFFNTQNGGDIGRADITAYFARLATMFQQPPDSALTGAWARYLDDGFRRSLTSDPGSALTRLAAETIRMGQAFIDQVTGQP